MNGNIYIAHLREHASSKQHVYKIGQTSQGFRKNRILKRMGSYPKGTVQVAVYETPNPVHCERLVMHALNNHPSIYKRSDLGNEYFQGDVMQIKSIIQKVIENDSDTNDPCIPVFSSDAAFYLCHGNPLDVHDRIPRGEKVIMFSDALIPTIESNDHLKCIYCNYTFTHHGNARRHERNCKENTVLRNLEIDLNICIDAYHEKDCRFCNKDFSTRSHLMRHQKSCKKLVEYRKVLETRCNKPNDIDDTASQMNRLHHGLQKTDKRYITSEKESTLNKIQSLQKDEIEQDTIIAWILEDQQSTSKVQNWKVCARILIQQPYLKVNFDRSNKILCDDVPFLAEYVIASEFELNWKHVMFLRELHEDELVSKGVNIHLLDEYLKVIKTREYMKKHYTAIMKQLKSKS